MKKLFIILIFFSIISNVSASIKENIIKKFTDIKNVSFNFEQNINGKIDYINTHGTSTPIGDVKELEAIKNVFGSNIPKMSSTKSLTGHSLGATGVHEAIYSLLMMKNNFISGSANIENLDDSAKDCNILLKTENEVKIEHVMSNSFGFGGTNATLVFSKYHA